MKTNRRVAVVAGAAFLVATIAQMAGVALVSPILDAPDYLAEISANEDRVVLGALLQFIGGVACAGIALALYPVLRMHNHGLAMGSVGFRTIEGVLHGLIAVCWLLLVTLSQEAANAAAPGSSAYAVPGALLMAGPAWLAPLALLVFGLGALCYYWVFFRSRLIPRWLSAWGLVAIVMVMASGILVTLGLIDAFSTPQLVLAAPIGVQEMVLAVLLIAKGFTPTATTAQAADEMPRRRAEASTASS